jgi:hypothetical protein
VWKTNISQGVSPSSPRGPFLRIDWTKEGRVGDTRLSSRGDNANRPVGPLDDRVASSTAQ